MTEDQQRCLAAIHAVNLTQMGDEILDPAMVMTICEIESSWRFEAYREEPRIQDASYGVMQVLFKTAQWLGFTGNRNDLYQPEVCILYGMLLLKKNFQTLKRHLEYRDPNMFELVASYNCGAGGVIHGNRDVPYVLKFANAYERWKGEVK